MIKLFFGLPGCGKTTLLAATAYKESRKKGRRRKYENIYSNVRLAIPGVTYIDNDCIGKYDLRNCLLLIDEATLFADSRDFKAFDKGKLTYFLEHRHFRSDIFLFTQQWDGVDRKIRVITDRVYYMYKGLLFGKLFSSYYRIPYGIIIPDKKDNGEKLGEIVQGYCKPSLMVRLLSKKLYRPFYYRFFDSFETPHYPGLPSSYKPYVKPDKKKKTSKEALVLAHEGEDPSLVDPPKAENNTADLSKDLFNF